MTDSYMEIKDDKAVAHIEGPAVIDTAVQIHKVFCDALESKKAVVIDIINVSGYDSTFFQLIRSLCYSLRLENRTLELDEKCKSDLFYETAKEMGIDLRNDCTRNCGSDVSKECYFTKLIKSSVKSQEAPL